ncbi:gamma vacuolar processing enzyme, asparaginyl endopeptidase 3, legumain gamma [Hibiscus trionum]|uniref:Gamma vacuolar processing enzyme, asparaginyl endopeptidase 3, legumain gamma n=1 Tax=Hibiscus trionum TaxID=183268 RepID=A0A9W7I6A0_HIBTR|nr:gamma vacuolar processing enzyme, asparaginyl endopeptidase 3, legumain gamma [Hibiscus trionum]
MTSHCGLFLFLALSCIVVESRRFGGNSDGLSSNVSEFLHSADSNVEGKRWAVLIAGSNGYENYRHQADICHAYQILRKGGLEDENIIVFMYDDIAFNVYNPRPGVVINKPNGEDVYEGVPKDYTGEDVNVNNFLAAILGNKTGITGGSGKVVESSPNDYIFIYYADHGSTGILGMPSGDYLTAQDLMNTLKQKHAAKSYKSMVIYVEACESGSMFEGILPSDIDNIYVITAANANESSWAAYCPDDFPSPPSGFDTCLGDLFSISWLEDSDIHDLRNETLEQQYQVVRRRTAVDDLDFSSHVMQYGNKGIGEDSVFNYIGTNPNNDHYSPSDNPPHSGLTTTPHIVSQHDASLLHFWHKYHNAPEGSPKKTEAHKELVDQLSLRKHMDQSIHEIISVVFGREKISEMLNSVQSAGNPVVHDWDCFKLLVKSFRKHCGSTSRTRYDMKYSGAFANMCNAGVDISRATQAITQACSANAPPS